MEKNPDELKSMEDKTDALSRLAENICKLVGEESSVTINRTMNEVISINRESQATTVYRLLGPEHFGLELIENKDEMNGKEKISTITTCSSKRTSSPVTSSSREEKMRRHLKSSEEENSINPEKTITATQKTRSGRIIKVHPKTSLSLAELLNSNNSPEFESMTNLLNNLKDSDYRGPKSLRLSSSKKKAATKIEIENDNEMTSSRKRKIPLEAICPTCHKIFLGRRLHRHFVQHPDHMKKSNSEEESLKKTTTTTDDSHSTEKNGGEESKSLFHFLIGKLQKSTHLSEDQKADLLLSEMNDFVEQLHLRAARLIRNTSGLHFVSTKTARLLGIPEGHYALDLNAFEAPLEAVEEVDPTQSMANGATNSAVVLNTRSLDYTNLSITIDETLTDEAAQKLNLSAGGKLLPPSEESLLRGVADLVHTDINKIHPTNSSISAKREAVNKLLNAKTVPMEEEETDDASSVMGNLLPPHLDHVSDNAVEAVSMKETPVVAPTPSTLSSLDLSVDFFEFDN